MNKTSPTIDYTNNLHKALKPLETSQERLYAAQSDLEFLALDFEEQISLLNKKLQWNDITWAELNERVDSKSQMPMNRQILSLIERIDNGSINLETTKMELKHLRVDVCVLERVCDWSRPTDDIVDATLQDLQLYQHQIKQLTCEIEHLRATNRATSCKVHDDYMMKDSTDDRSISAKKSAEGSLGCIDEENLSHVRK